MIEIVSDKERNLKNLKQIGTPREDNKIYIENFAYAKIKEESYKEKRVFVLMGHTERMENNYATFVEAIISVKEIDFSGNTPRWNNSTWSEVFREIKRLYEDMIIVGWAIDIKGMSVKLSPELERVHREHFGGVHQLLFLLDTLEQEETFYMYKENKLVQKDGFYIYHRARKREEPDVIGKKQQQEPIPITIRSEKSRAKESQVDVELNFSETTPQKGGQYRQLLQNKNSEKVTDNGNVGLAIAVAMLVFVIGVGLYENKDDILGTTNAVETNLMQNQDSTETGITIEEKEDTEASIDIIPVEIISGTEQQE